MFLYHQVATRRRTHQRKTVLKRQQGGCNKQFHVFCICSVIGLTLLSLHRLSSTLQPPPLGQHDLTGENDDDDEAWRDFVEDYEKRFQRGPPPSGFDAWFQFATRNQCETRRYYESLDADLAYFRNNNIRSSSLLQWDRVIPEGLNRTDNYIALELENHELRVVAYQTEKQHEKAILRLYHWLLKPLVQHSSPAPLYSKFIINLYDVATVQSVDATYPMFSFCKMDYLTDHQPPPPAPPLLNNSNNNNSKDKDHNDLVYAYAAEMFNNHTPGPQKRSTGSSSMQDNDDVQKIEIVQSSTYGRLTRYVQSKDLIVPWHFSLRFISQQLWWWPFYNKHGAVPYARRKNVISWRGSTTGPWKTGARFKLVQEFGGRGIHPLVTNSNKSHTNSSVSNPTSNSVVVVGGVSADFAFIKVVQQPPNAESLSRDSYRFARHMFYREMQQNKYILDIDGNGTFPYYCIVVVVVMSTSKENARIGGSRRNESIVTLNATL
jgi:hypothetical protein